MEVRCQCSFSSGLSHSGPNGSQNHLEVISPSSGMHIWSRYTQQLVESLQWFLDLWSEDCYGGKGKCKPLELPLPRKIIKQKQYLIPGELLRLVPPSRT